MRDLALAASLAIAAPLSMSAEKLSSVRINDDKSVTIKYFAPEADELEVKGAFVSPGLFGKLAGITDKERKAEMEESGDGYWTYTSKPLKSDLYWYNFHVDDSDTPVADTDNPALVRDISTMYNYFIIPGKVGNDYMDRKSENGSVEYVWYPSSLPGMTRRRMAVYLPYGYSADKTKRYPVLYLLHGSGGDETAWLDCGRLAQIMDNMIAEGRCEPMIVVMPNGNVKLAAAPGSDPANRDVKPSANNTASMKGDIENAFVPEIVDYVDSHFRTVADKGHRAIAGLSLGGLHTLFTAVNNPGTFDYIGLFSAQTVATIGNTGIADIHEIGDKITDVADSFLSIFGAERKKSKEPSGGHPEIYKDFDSKLDNFYNADPRMVYIAVGSADFTKKLNDDLRRKLYDKEYQFVYNESEGGHTWTNWRRYLRDFLPKLKFNE